jgi:chaperonin GroEL
VDILVPPGRGRIAGDIDVLAAGHGDVDVDAVGVTLMVAVLGASDDHTRRCDAAVVALDPLRLLAHGRFQCVGVANVLECDLEGYLHGAGPRKGLAADGATAWIRREIDKATSDYDKEKLRERLAKLAGGVAVVRVGAPSESEMKAKKEALDDGISATKAAVGEGIMPGGGLALLRCMDAVSEQEARSEGDEKIDVQILKRALSAPARQIAENSAVDGGVVVAKMIAGKGNSGFDAARNVYVDLVEAGIIDPTKVVRIALENAVSVAGVLLLTEATMTELPERKKLAAPEQELARGRR